MEASARTIPSGLWRRELASSPSPKLTISLFPNPTDQGVIDLRYWPTQLEKCLKVSDGQPNTPRLVIRPIPTLSGDAPLPQPKDVTADNDTGWALLPWRASVNEGSSLTGASEQLAEITRLWQLTMPVKEGEDFDDLYTQLKIHQQQNRAAEAGQHNEIKSVLPSVAGQITLLTQFERAIVQMAGLSGPVAERNLVETAMKVGLEELDKLKAVILKPQAGEVPATRFEMPKPGNGSAAVSFSAEISQLKADAARQLCADEDAQMTADALARGAALAGRDAMTACVAKLQSGAIGASCATSFVLSSFEEVLRQLFCLYYKNLRARALGKKEFAALKDCWDDDAKRRNGRTAGVPDQPEGAELYDPRKTEEDSANKIRLLTQRMQELQENTELARLFRLVADYEVHQDAVSFLLRNAVHVDPIGRKACYFYARLNTVPKGETNWLNPELSYWTLAKASFSETNTLLAFVPVSFEELAVCFGCEGSRGIEILPRMDGVRLLSARPDGWKSGSELTSINPRDAVQDLDTRLSDILNAADAAGPAIAGEDEARVKRAVYAFLEGRPADDPYPLAAHKSRAVRLLDFHRFDRTCRALALSKVDGVSLAHDRPEARALDADDLALGVLFDVAAQAPGPRTVATRPWRPASAARVRYSLPSQFNIDLDLDAVIDEFFRVGERQRYQRATAAFFDQIKTESDDTAAAISDEVAFEFADEQQGTDVAAGERRRVGGRVRYVSKIDRSSMLDVNREYLELERDGDRPWPLRFGYGIDIADRDIWLGGGSIDDASAGNLRELIPAASVPRCDAPTVRSRNGYAFVRAEKVVRPQILLDGSAPANAAGSYSRRYLPSSTAEITLRSIWNSRTQGYDAAETIGEESLIVLPGAVDVELAHMHGSFDVAAMPTGTGENLPTGALAGRADRPREIGGWPTLNSIIATFPDGQVLRERRLIRQGPPASGSANGDGVYRNGTQSSAAPPYYPDPLHRAYVLRFRRIGTRDRWVGRSLVVEARGLDGMNRDPNPLRLRFQRGGPALTMRRSSATAGPGTTIQINMSIPPGLSLELVVWALPDLVDLALTHEVVHLNATLAVRLARDGCTGPETLTDEQRELGPLAELLACGTDFTPADANAGAGIGGQCQPTLDQLLATARWLHERLKREPVDELVGRSSIQVHHAADRPTRVPEPVAPSHWGVSDAPPGPLVARRSSDRNRNNPGPALVSSPGSVPDWFFSSAERTGAAVAQRGGTDVDIAGYLRIDPASTGAVEILAEVVAPTSTNIDGNRSRGLRRVRQGDFYGDEAGRLGSGVTAEDVYGFKVRTDGTVELPTRLVTLARFEDIPEFVHSPLARITEEEGQESPEGLLAQAEGNANLTDEGWTPPEAYLSLHELFSVASNADEDDSRGASSATTSGEIAPGSTSDGVRADVLAILGHTQSRILRLRFRALSRHGPRLALAPKLQGGIFLPAELPPPSSMSAATEEALILTLSASRRPAVPVTCARAKPSLLPTVLSGDPARYSITSTRRAQVRIYLSRPYFSSGERERIGVILSPRPSSFLKDGSYERDRDALLLKKDRRFRLHEPFTDPRHVPEPLIHQLTQYCPRGDRPEPRAANLAARLKFYPLPLQMFADASFSTEGAFLRANRSDVDYVVSAQLPLYQDRESPASRDEPSPPQEYFPVDLLTYAPKFSVALECWYIDVNIAPHHSLFPYFKLGIVRYNPDAPRDLAVSNVGEAQLCPILPARRTTVEMAADSKSLKIQVIGPMHPPKPAGAVGGASVETTMTAILRRTRQNNGAEAIPLRDIVKPLEVSERGAETRIDLGEIRAEEENLRILIEEKERRLYSEFGAEPVSPETAANTWSTEGPSPYLTILDLWENEPV